MAASIALEEGADPGLAAEIGRQAIVEAALNANWELCFQGPAADQPDVTEILFDRPDTNSRVIVENRVGNVAWTGRRAAHHATPASPTTRWDPRVDDNTRPSHPACQHPAWQGAVIAAATVAVIVTGRARRRAVQPAAVRPGRLVSAATVAATVIALRHIRAGRARKRA
jgi:hypothetical protein